MMCNIKATCYIRIFQTWRIHNVLIQNTTNYACSCCSFISNKYKKFVKGIKQIYKCHDLFFVHCFWPIGGYGSRAGAEQIPLAYIHVYFNQECYNIKFVWLGWIPFSFLFQTYLLIRLGFFSLKNANMCSYFHKKNKHADWSTCASLKIGDKIEKMRVTMAWSHQLVTYPVFKVPKIDFCMIWPQLTIWLSSTDQLVLC